MGPRKRVANNSTTDDFSRVRQYLEVASRYDPLAMMRGLFHQQIRRTRTVIVRPSKPRSLVAAGQDYCSAPEARESGRRTVERCLGLENRRCECLH